MALWQASARGESKYAPQSFPRGRGVRHSSFSFTSISEESPTSTAGRVKPEAQGAHDLDHGRELRIAAGGQRLVEALSSQARFRGHFRHAFRPRDIAQSGRDERGVTILESRVDVCDDLRLGTQVVRRVPGSGSPSSPLRSPATALTPVGEPRTLGPALASSSHGETIAQRRPTMDAVLLSGRLTVSLLISCPGVAGRRHHPQGAGKAGDRTLPGAREAVRRLLRRAASIGHEPLSVSHAVAGRPAGEHPGSRRDGQAVSGAAGPQRDREAGGAA